VTAKLFVVSSPSGAGKSTLIRHVRGTFPRLRFSVSCTTRPPRRGEADGREYHFLGKDEFMRRVEAGEFVEWEEVYGNYYGTLKSEVRSALDRDDSIIVEIDVKGMKRFTAVFPDAVTVFIDLPSIEEYRRRLEKRGSETPETMERRLAEIERERQEKPRFRYVVINGRLEEAKRRFVDIFRQELEISQERL